MCSVRHSFLGFKVSFATKYYKKHNFWRLLAYNSKANQPKLLIELITLKFRSPSTPSQPKSDRDATKTAITSKMIIT